MSLNEHCRAPFIAMQLGAALCFVTAVSCGGSNEPSVMNGNTESGGKSASDDSKGSAAGSAASGDAAGKAATGAGGSPSSSSSSSGNSSSGNSSGGSGNSSSAGTSASKAGSSASTGNGGSGASSGSSSGSSGSGAAGSSSGSGAMSGAATGNGMFSPLCDAVPATAAGAQPKKGGACTDADPQLCYNTCGPQSIGFKSETCTNGAYAEMTGCSFPDADYACFKIPAMVDASCPMTAPQASMPCEVAECTPCNVGGMYMDSSGSAKTGYCVCPKAGDSGMRKWSCASTTAWPCPAGKGC